MKYICNPINMEYKYQFIEMNGMKVNREAADPSLILFNGKYFLFPSMTTGFLVSDNLVDWEFHPLKDVPIYDYAPDVRIIGDYMYFTASNAEKNGSFYRTKDPIHGHFEEIEGTFPFWDPNLFVDDDGRVYFYWGCSNSKPIYGIELQPDDMKPIGEPSELIFNNQSVIGYERNGENHIPPKTPEQIEQAVQRYAQSMPNATEEMLSHLRVALGNDPYIEGAWMDKHEGRYYLQYSSPGTQYNVYSDGVYVSDKPLGPFTLAKNNPYSFKPGGFIQGAGHGSTLEDKYGNFWHASTMRISVNHMFERRLGLWSAGFDQDGELYCNQRYGDWPMKIEQAENDTWANPEWMLLSYGKPAKASSHVQGKEAMKATDENVQTWWKAVTNEAGQYLEIDLLDQCQVHAVQINFADDQLDLSLPNGAEMRRSGHTPRYIDHRKHVTRWLLEGSLDGTSYFVIKDKSNVDTDLAHDLIVREEGLKARFIRCTVIELPYRQQACISGLRVFGIGTGDPPIQVSGVKTDVQNGLDLSVAWNQDTAVGYNVLWGYTSEKLYHSYMVLGKYEVCIGALIKGEPVYVRVDAFNETGITEGEVIKVI
ncbi:1,4-beta-xylanase [Paenibacillus sp. FSL H8-0548]|uniref:family 43 glycosylhydrolase n=1 Tax=Paenibacillus sp. FSL H8-0548 TaxID=1920422 RepID=UPI00096C9AAC|nr:family 43 glycosylhydrolase [Paenibacillus sp. FSL H8-0548]OMF26750.1 1,4-beta-xylanase [Paenibacillus sp. FSL H8-0548]